MPRLYARLEVRFHEPETFRQLQRYRQELKFKTGKSVSASEVAERIIEEFFKRKERLEEQPGFALSAPDGG